MIKIKLPVIGEARTFENDKPVYILQIGEVIVTEEIYKRLVENTINNHAIEASINDNKEQ